MAFYTKQFFLDINHGATTVTSGGVLIVPEETKLGERNSIIIYNNSAETVYLGKQGVTTANGFPLKENSAIEIEAGAILSIYGITAGANADVRWIEGT